MKLGEAAELKIHDHSITIIRLATLGLFCVNITIRSIYNR